MEGKSCVVSLGGGLDDVRARMQYAFARVKDPNVSHYCLCF